MVAQSLSGGARATADRGATLGSAHLCSPGLYLRMRSQMALRAYGSTPAVGSSKITARDPPTKAMATDSFLFMPPERVCTREWRLLESSRSSIILGTWEKRHGCRGGAVLAPSACGGAHDASSPHLWPSATGTAQLQPGYRSIFFWLPQPDTPSFGKHLVSCSRGHLCYQITHHNSASRKGTHSCKRRRWGKRSWRVPTCPSPCGSPPLPCS